jgi:hypothetical protein
MARWSLPLTLTLTLLAGPALAEEIRPGVEYRGPKSLGAAELGVQFTLPKGWTGGLPPGAELFLIGSDGQQGRLLLLADELGMAEAKAQMSAPIEPGDGMVLTPLAPPQVKGRTLTADYRVSGTPQPLSGYVHTVIGKHGVGVAIIAVASAQALPTFKKLAQNIAASLKFAKPAAARQAKPPAAAPGAGEVLPRSGVRITRFFTGSGYSEKTVINLCSNGTFRRHFDASSASALGTGAAVSKGDGTWSATNTQLTLRYHDGNVATYQLRLDGSKLMVDGQRWFREFQDCF